VSVPSSCVELRLSSYVFYLYFFVEELHTPTLLQSFMVILREI